MNWLNPIPLLYRWLAIGALVLAFGAFCGFKGYAAGIEKLHKAQAAAVLEGGRILTTRTVVTEKIVTKYLPQIVKQKVAGELTVKEIHAHANPADPPVAGSFRVWHDAAAAGSVPDPARLADGAAVPLEDASATVAENYAACRADQLKLTGLQEWVRVQGKVR